MFCVGLFIGVFCLYPQKYPHVALAGVSSCEVARAELSRFIKRKGYVRCRTRSPELFTPPAIACAAELSAATSSTLH